MKELVKNAPESSPDRPSYSMGLFDPDNPRSLYECSTESLKASIDAAVLARPDLFKLEERTLLKILRAENKTPNATDNRLRIRFWEAYERAVGSTREGSAKINISWIVEGVVSQDYLYERYLKIPEKVAWMLTPPMHYDIVAKETLAFGMEQLRDIMELPHLDKKTGKVDHKIAGLKLRALQLIHLWVKGAPVQKSMALHGFVARERISSEFTELSEMNSMEALETRIKELEARERKAQHIVDATVVDPE